MRRVALEKIPKQKSVHPPSEVGRRQRAGCAHRPAPRRWRRQHRPALLVGGTFFVLFLFLFWSFTWTPVWYVQPSLLSYLLCKCKHKALLSVFAISHQVNLDFSPNVFVSR